MNTPVVLKNTWLEWVLSGCVGGVGVTTFMFAMILRGRPLSLYSFNKSAALTAMLLVLMVVAFGSLYRVADLSRLVRYRRPLGIIAVVLMSAHAGVSLFWLPGQYDWGFYASRWESLLFGLVAWTGFLLLWLTSYKVMHVRMGRAAWKKLQNGIYLLLASGFLHLCHSGKPVCWLGWLEGRPEQTCTRHGWMPPLSFVLFLCLALVSVARLLEPLARRRGDQE